MSGTCVRGPVWIVLYCLLLILVIQFNGLLLPSSLKRISKTSLAEFIANSLIKFEDKPSEEAKKLRPVFVEFQEKTNDSKNTVEKFMIFFATSKR